MIIDLGKHVADLLIPKFCTHRNNEYAMRMFKAKIEISLITFPYIFDR